jgi:transcriptional regulator with XRE-family HTH domain
MAQPRRGRPPASLDPDASHAARLGAELRERRQARGSTLQAFGARVGYSVQHVSDVERANTPASATFIAECDRVLETRGALLDLLPAVVYERAVGRAERGGARRREPDADANVACSGRDDAELEAIELGDRARSGDMSSATLDGLELQVHELCRRYTRVPPVDLLGDVRRCRRAIFGLLDARATLRQRRRLMVTAGWVSLLAACLHVDVDQQAAAVASRRVAHDLGADTGDRQIVAWGLEVRAWQAILAQRYDDAVRLCRAGQDFAGADTSAAVQLTAQEARASARLRQVRETHVALDRAAAACGRLPAPDFPDHHFSFDPRKLTSYTATALAWLGDGERAEPLAREVIELRQRENRPRRLATARIDLALVLARDDRPEEACTLGHLALDSRRLVPSNIWRAAELDAVLRRYDAPSIGEFHDRYVAMRELVVGGLSSPGGARAVRRAGPARDTS